MKGITNFITNVKYAPMKEGDCFDRIIFLFHGIPHECELHGRNKDLVLGFGEDKDKAIATRCLLDTFIKGNTNCQ